MDIKKNYDMIGTLDSTKIKEKLQKFNWNEWTHRQDTYTVHEKTKSIPLIFSGDNIGSDIVSHDENCALFSEELCIIKHLFDYFYSGNFLYTRALLAKLENRESIPSHHDGTENFTICHRVHWCIEGDYSKLNFLVNNEKLNIRKNDIFEFNNLKIHEVNYKGNESRIHMICDFISEENYNNIWLK